MDPSVRYVSLLFDELSMSAGGACVAETGPTPYEFGAWKVAPDGTGQLKVLLDSRKLGDIHRMGAVSVHSVDETGTAPKRIRACGALQFMN